MFKSRQRTGADAVTSRPGHRTLILALAAAGLALGPVSRAGAEDDVYHWTNPDGGFFQDPDNWNQDNWPGDGQLSISTAPGVVFDLDESYAVTIQEQQDPDFVLNGRVDVLAGEVSLDAKVPYFLGNDGSSPLLNVGGDGPEGATFRLVGGELVAGVGAFPTDVRIGHEAGSRGTVEVTGADTLLRPRATMHVGYAGEGALVVADQAEVGDGIGQLALVILGGASTGEGTVIARGHWDEAESDHVGGIRNLVVGDAGTGNVTVEDGGFAFVDVIGRKPGSHGTVVARGSNSVIRSRRALDVGFGGDGTLIIEDGAGLSTFAGGFSTVEMTVGALEGAEGKVILRGEGTTWAPFSVKLQLDSALEIDP